MHLRGTHFATRLFSYSCVQWGVYVPPIPLHLPPGDPTLYHPHTHDRVAIPLSGTSITQQVWNEKEGPPSRSEPGSFSALTLAGSAYTHRVHNVGVNPYDVLDVELLVRP